MTHGGLPIRLRPSRGQLLAVATAFFYAFQNLAMRAAAPSVDAFVVAFFAGLPTVLVSLVLVLATRTRLARVTALWRDAGGRRLLGGLVVAGVLMYVVGNPLFIRALAVGGAVVATPSGNTIVIWSALLAALLLGEPVNRSVWTGVALFIGGVLLLSWGQGNDVPVGPGWYWAVPLGLGAGLCWASGSIASRYALVRGTDTITILGVYGLAGFGLVALFVVANGRLAGFLRSAPSDPQALRSLTLMTLAGLFNLGAQVSQTLAYSSETVARATVISSSSAAIVAPLAWALLGETLNLVMFAGILTAFAGTVLVQQQITVQPSSRRPRPGDQQAARGTPPGSVPLPTKRQEESRLH